jgi:PKD repeat protein
VKTTSAGILRIIGFMLFLAESLLTISCKKDYPLPEVGFTYSVNGNIVNFKAELKNAATFTWDFGDGPVAENDTNPVHTYNIYDKEYTVILNAESRGGKVNISRTVTIPPMTSMEKLSGNKFSPEGKKWRLSQSAGIIKAKADAALTASETISPAMLSSCGLNSLFNEQFIFQSNGDFKIYPAGESITAGLNYCSFRHIENNCPSTEARNHNLTLTPILPPEGLTYGFTQLKDFSVEVSDDGISSEIVTFHDVQSISISYGGFLGIMDFFREYIVLDLTPDTMKIACFCCSTSFHGAADYVLILNFEQVS